MKSITDPFQNLDSVVVALTDTVGFIVFPGVLYVSTPVADHVCNMAYFRNVRRAVNFEPFGQLCTLESRYGHVVDVVETLKCLIGFIEIRIGFQKLVDAFFHNQGFPVILGIDAGLLGNEHAHGSLQQPVVWSRWIQITLELHSDRADTFIQMFDDMEHIDADHGAREHFFRNRNKAVVHVTAVEADFVTFGFGKLTEVFLEVSNPDHRKDVDDGTTVTIDDVGVVFAFEPAMSVTVPDAAVAFEFINGDGFGKLADSIKADQIEDGVDDRFGYAVFFCDSSERLYFCQ